MVAMLGMYGIYSYSGSTCFPLLLSEPRLITVFHAGLILAASGRFQEHLSQLGKSEPQVPWWVSLLWIVNGGVAEHPWRDTRCALFFRQVPDNFVYMMMIYSFCRVLMMSYRSVWNMGGQQNHHDHDDELIPLKHGLSTKTWWWSIYMP